MKKPLIIVIVAVVVIGAGIAVYFITQSEDTNTNASTNSASQTNTSAAATNAEPADRYDGVYFTVLKPADWVQSQVAGTLVSFHNANEVHPEGSAASIINFNSYIAISFAEANEMTLVEVNNLLTSQIKASVPSTEVTASSDETIDGLPAKFNTLTMTQQEIDVQIFLAVILKGDKYFTFTGNTTSAKWAEFKDLFYETARSFVFKD